MTPASTASLPITRATSEKIVPQQESPTAETSTTAPASVIQQGTTHATVDTFRVLLVLAVLAVVASFMVRRFRNTWLDRAIHRAEKTTGKTREKIISEAIERGEEDLGVLDGQIAAMRQTLPPQPTVAPTPDAEFKAHRASTAAFTICVIDAAVQPVTFANAGVALHYAIPLGVGIAAALGLAPSRICEFGFLSDENHDLVLDRVKIVTRGISVVTGIAAGVWTFARFADASTAAYLMPVDEVISFAIAEGLGLLGGMLAAQSHIWRRPALRIAHRNATVRKLTRHETKRTKLMAGLGRLRAIGAVTLLVLATARARAQVVRPTTIDRPVAVSGDRIKGAPSAAVDVISSAASSRRSARAEHGVDETCRIFVDRTESGDPSSRDEAVRAVSARLPEILGLLNCGNVAVATLPGRDTLFMNFQWTQVPAPPDSTRVCAGIAQHRRGLMGGFQGFKEARDGECARSLDSARRARSTEFQSAVQVIRSQIDHTSAEPIPDRTGLMLAIELCVQRGDLLCLIISDALETAGPMHRVDAPDGQHLLIVQYLPARDYGGAKSAGDAARAFCELVPRLHVIQYTALGEPGLLPRLFTEDVKKACAREEQ